MGEEVRLDCGKREVTELVKLTFIRLEPETMFEESTLELPSSLLTMSGPSVF